MFRILAALITILLLTVPTAGAQDSAMSARIVAGTCDATGDIIADLQSPQVPTGDPVGATAGQTAGTSFTTAPVALEVLLSADHAIVITNGTVETACGEIGGVQENPGALAIVLTSAATGMRGIAYLSVNPTDPTSTSVSLFVGGGTLDGTDDATVARSGAETSPSTPETSGTTPETGQVDATTRDATTQPDQASTSESGVVRSDDPGSRDEPLPIGTAADIGGGWYVSVIDVNPNGTDLVLAENMFNDPPEPGQQFVLITVSATYDGPEASSELPSGNAFQVVGDSAVAYTSFDPGCGVIPNELPRTEVFSGGTITGNICFAVASDDVDSLVMFSEDFVTFDRDIRVWFALR